MSLFKSKLLKEIEQWIVSYVSSDNPKPLKFIINEETKELSPEDLEELKAFFVRSSLIVGNKSISNVVSQQRKNYDNFRREIEKTLFKSIYPNDWQIDSLLGTLKLFLNWKNPQEKKIVSVYENYIRKAISSLEKRRVEIDREIGWTE